MWSSFRNAVSRWAEARLRWLTASALRSTAIFVILTFVPILLLTYYIVATNIRNTKAEAEGADKLARDNAVSLLRADFRGEREALAGASDETSLQRLLTSEAVVLRLTPPPSPPPRPGKPAPRPRRPSVALRRAEHAQAQALTDAAASLNRLHRRRQEFTAVALYDPSGSLLAQAPAGVPLAPTVADPSLPDWFTSAREGNTAATSPVLDAAAGLPQRVTFAVQVSFPLPPEVKSGAPAGAQTAAANGNGVLIGALPTSAIADWVRHINLGADRYLYLVDADHRLVTAPANGPFTAAQIAALPATAAALRGQSGSGEYDTAIQFESHAISYAALPDVDMALLVVRPVHFGFYIYRVFYDKLAFIAVIIFLLAVATGLLLRGAFRYYQRYNREVETGRAKTEALLGSIADGVFAVDGEGIIIEFNRAAAALTGHRAESALGRHYGRVIALAEERAGQPPEPAADPVRQAMTQGRTLRFLRDLILIRRDGSRLPITLSAAPLTEEDGAVQGCIVVFSDASQEREVDRMKNEFISIASHQLRTPMTGVKGALALLLEEVLGPLNPEQRNYLRRANDSNERLIALVNDLLNVSRLEQGSLQLRSEPVNLGEMLAALAGDFQARAARYQQRIEFGAPAAAADAVVHGDPVRLREVFTNLLDNAIKYTPEGGRIAVRLRPQSQDVVVEVADTGVGIPPDKISGLFQKFNRIQNPLSGREFGTGLGLYFARSVVELHQGTIEVDSQPGEGTVFRVTLPREHRASAPHGSLH